MAIPGSRGTAATLDLLPTNSTLVVYAACPTRLHTQAVSAQNLRLLREHVERAMIVAVTCSAAPASLHALRDADVLVDASCAASLAYDAGMWQAGLRLAQRMLGRKWQTLRCGTPAAP